MNKIGVSKYLWILAIVVIVILIGVYFIFLGDEDKYSGEVEKVTISHTENPDVGLLLIAQDKGYFADEGLDVSFVKHNSGRDSLNAVLENEVDYGVSAETPIVYASFKEKEFYILSRIYSGENTEGIIANRDKGISDVNDLKGKKIGYLKGTSSEFYLDSFLKLNKIDTGEVITIDKNPTELRDAILNKEIDAVSIWHPVLHDIIKELGAEGILFDDNGLIYTYKFYLVSRKDFVEENVEINERLLRALVKAEEFFNKNQEETFEFLAEKTESDYEYIIKSYKKNTLRLDLSQDMILALEDQARWAIENNLTEKTEIPNYLDYIYADTLKEIKPYSIGITGYLIKE